MSAAKIVSLINMKGGVGKTTLAVGLAWELAKKHKVLLVDIDPQFNATQWIVSPEVYLDWLKNKHTVLDIFKPNTVGNKGEAALKPSLESTVIPVKNKNITLNILPSELDLMSLDAAPRGTENRLRVFLNSIKNHFEYILIDCPPTASLFSYSAFLASDAYLVPVKPDPLSVLGLPLLARAMQDYEERSGQELKRLGLVFTQVRQTDAMYQTMAQVRKDFPNEVFSAHIDQTTGVAEAVEENKPLQHKSSSGKFTDVKTSLSSICTEFKKRIKEI